MADLHQAIRAYMAGTGDPPDRYELANEVLRLRVQLAETERERDELDDGAGLLDRVRALCAAMERLRAQVAARDASIDALTERIRLLHSGTKEKR